MMERNRPGELPAAASPPPHRNTVTQCSRGQEVITANAKIPIDPAGRRAGVTRLREWRLEFPVECNPLRRPSVGMLRPRVASGL